MSEAIKIAIVGHTNTGKTSFIRALLRDSSFGKVENRASTTRHVEAAVLGIHRGPEFIFYDTPGMEDAIGILDVIDGMRGSMRDEGAQLIEDFIKKQESYPQFVQEIKVLRQALKSELLIYVIDAREPVLGKYRDELQLLNMCGRPILPLFNFTAQDNQSQSWREVLRNISLHVIADFDTVLYNLDHEIQMLEQIKLLLHERAADIDILIKERKQQGIQRTQVAKQSVARALINLAAWQERYQEEEQTSEQLEAYKETSRREEQKLLKELLDIYDFDMETLAYTPLNLEGLNWQDDVFDSETWALYGLDVGSAVAKGGAVGFTIDLLTGGLSLGMGTALGASAGLLLRKGRDWKHRIQGYKVWRLDKNSLKIMLARQQLVLKTLSSRSHAQIGVSRLEDYDFASANLPKPLKKARFKSYWSELNDDFRASSSSRAAAVKALSEEL